ncbi:uncharacterized protein LOC134228443 [Saccostrea cucullata]|uniref:uncharacterized protein LOC134228443 n=1 Tax=Saccostrea cuccullata TaxID=36930 RepID=UPI002ED133E0
MWFSLFLLNFIIPTVLCVWGPFQNALSGYGGYLSTAKSVMQNPYLYGSATAVGVMMTISKSKLLQSRINLTINNELKNGILVNPEISLEYGVDEANPKWKIGPGESFSLSFRGPKYLPLGTTGVLTYQFHETDFALAVAWSVPFLYHMPLMNFDSNRFGINVYKKSCESEPNSTVAIHKPGKWYLLKSTEVFKSEKIVVYGSISSEMTDAKLEIVLKNA